MQFLPIESSGRLENFQKSAENRILEINSTFAVNVFLMLTAITLYKDIVIIPVQGRIDFEKVGAGVSLGWRDVKNYFVEFVGKYVRTLWQGWVRKIQELMNVEGVLGINIFFYYMFYHNNLNLNLGLYNT